MPFGVGSEEEEDQSLFDGTRLESRTGKCGTRWSRFQMSALQPKFFANLAPSITFVTATGFNAHQNDEMELAPTCPSAVDLASSWTAGIMRMRWFSISIMSKIIGDITSVSVGQNLCRHLSTVWFSDECANKSLSFVQLRRSFIGSERTHLHHKIGNSLGACAVAVKRHHRPASDASWRPNEAIISQEHVVRTIEVLDTSWARVRRSRLLSRIVYSAVHLVRSRRPRKRCSFCHNCLRVDEDLEHEPDFIAAPDGQRDELVCSLGGPSSRTWL